jgi:hypothetical protein
MKWASSQEVCKRSEDDGVERKHFSAQLRVDVYIYVAANQQSSGLIDSFCDQVLPAINILLHHASTMFRFPDKEDIWSCFLTGARPSDFTALGNSSGMEPGDPQYKSLGKGLGQDLFRV